MAKEGGKLAILSNLKCFDYVKKTLFHPWSFSPSYMDIPDLTTKLKAKPFLQMHIGHCYIRT